MKKLKKGFTISETLISITVGTFVMIASAEMLLKFNTLDNKISTLSEQRSYVTNIRENIFNEVSKAKFFYFSHLQGMPNDILVELPDNSIETYTSSLTEAKESYNLAGIQDFTLSVPNYSSLLSLGGNVQTESNSSQPVSGEIIHFSQIEVVDLIKLFKSKPSSSDSNSAFDLDYDLGNLDTSGNGKIMIRLINDCYIYPRKTKSINDEINKETHEIVVRKTQYAFQVVPDGRTLIQKYRPDIIMNTSIIEKNSSLTTPESRELAWKNLYEKITFKLIEKGYVPWTEMNSNSTYVDQNVSNPLINYLTLSSTPVKQYDPFFYKKVIGKYISQAPMIRKIETKDTNGNTIVETKEMSRNGLYFSLLKNVPDTETLGEIPETLIPGQKSHFISAIDVKIDLKKAVPDKKFGIEYITKTDDFVLETKNNRVYY